MSTTMAEHQMMTTNKIQKQTKSNHNLLYTKYDSKRTNIYRYSHAYIENKSKRNHDGKKKGKRISVNIRPELNMNKKKSWLCW